MTESFLNPNPLIRLQVKVFSPPDDINSSELAKELKELSSKAIIILGKNDDKHLQIYKEAIKEAELDPILIRIVDKDSKEELEYNKVILENAWTSDLALIEEKSEAINRRDLFTGKIKKRKEKIDKPVYINTYCNWLYRACNVCEVSCAYNAITVDKKTGVLINYDKCTACGLCVASCPVSALQFPSVSQQSIFELAKIKGDKKITCYKNDKSNGIKIPCLAMLSEVDITLLRSSGKLTFECPGCELEKNLKTFTELITELNNKIGGISFTSPLLTIESKEIKQLNVTSKTFYNKAEARKEIIEKEEDLPYIEFNVDIDNSCTICESCVKWCPTSALKLIRDTNTEKIAFNPTTCIGCNVCENVCPESCAQKANTFNSNGDNKIMSILNQKGKIIRVTKSKDFSRNIKTVFEDELVRCRVCGVPVGSRKSLNHVKKIMQEKGGNNCVDDEWLERCPKHRAEYSFQKKFGFEAKFKPKKVS
ncbi:4Fe-4S dicluster domain-containing protein [Acidianus manzaensis]|uniref:4Fe-4S ferredoxin n=1 Tax=Acidianus manzaensis TaxID=282676 RepID=A0A1W6JYK2_9CREN|nr:4Fe-4S dicluster domain-containing protein [Acidianus manzaensis]ARM75327.1 4Fe-4S ferredoxin [Acidianus manzaensis]